MLQTKNVNNWPCSLQNEVKNVKLLTNDDWWRPMEIDHPKNAEELIFWMIKFLCSLNSFWSSLKFEQNAIKMSLPETYHNTKHMYKSNTKLVSQNDPVNNYQSVYTYLQIIHSTQSLIITWSTLSSAKIYSIE